jgi:hypothetical protein
MNAILGAAGEGSELRWCHRIDSETRAQIAFLPEHQGRTWVGCRRQRRVPTWSVPSGVHRTSPEIVVYWFRTTVGVGWNPRLDPGLTRCPATWRAAPSRIAATTRQTTAAQTRSPNLVLRSCETESERIKPPRIHVLPARNRRAGAVKNPNAIELTAGRMRIQLLQATDLLPIASA